MNAPADPAKSVLIIDDSLTVRMDLTEALTENGFQVQAVDHLAAGREVLAQKKFPLLILDVQLPDGDGVDFLRELRASPATSDMRVMLLSAEAEVRDRIRGLQTAADDYVGKPYSIEYIIARALSFMRLHNASEARTAPVILLVDDSRTFREETREFLESAGYQVVTAASGEEALRAATRARPDAAVIDVMLPGMRGEEVIRRLKMDPIHRAMPCLLLTGADSAADELAGLEAGADAYLRKSGQFDTLAARLASLLRASNRNPGRPAAELADTSKVLAVDDRSALMSALTARLRMDGYDVAQARSGDEALELLPVEQVDVVMLGLGTPGLAAEEVCRRIKTHPQWRHIPVLMLIASDNQQSMIAALSAGADDCFARSVNFEVVLARLRAQLRRKHNEDENRRIQAELARKELEAAEAQAARASAETRARLVADLEAKNVELERARLEAEHAMQAKAAFLATMSHEIRTPLNAVIGISELLQSSVLDERQKTLLGIVQTSGTHLLAVINDILDFSKIDSGKLELDHHPFELRRCVEEALDLVSYRAAEKGLELAYHYGDGVPDGIIGDSNRVRQILVNFLSNAVKFTERGEVVVDVTSRLLEDGRHEIQFAVRDSGIGIPADRHDLLFRPFSQADTSVTRSFGGTGLGLVICKRLAELMDGRTWFESTVGKGSTFYFTITGPAAEILKQTPAPVASLAGLRLLVVDDSDVSRDLLRTAASTWGMYVRDTGLPSTALDWIRKGERFDLAFIDHLMPGMDGLTLAREIHKLRDLPLVLISAVTGGFASGEFVAALAKPIQQSTLLSAVQDIVSRHLLTTSTAADTAAPAEQESLGELKILLVEDNPVNQQVALLLLESLGYTADVANNGAEGVAAADTTPYDLILMDVQMPILDGLAATRQIRARPRKGKRPRIVAMTAAAFDSDRDQCIEAGMDDFASKPIQRRRLAEVLADTTGRDQRSVARALVGNREGKALGRVTAETLDDERFLRAIFGQLSTLLGKEKARDRLNALVSEATQAAASLPATGRIAPIGGEVLDQTKLKDLHAQGSPEQVDEVIRAYLIDTAERIDEIEQATYRNDRAAIRNALHAMKSTSGYLGARRLCALCEQLEADCTNADADCAASLPALREAYQTTRSALEQQGKSKVTPKLPTGNTAGAQAADETASGLANGMSFDYPAALARAANRPDLLKKIANAAIAQIPEWRGGIQSAVSSNSPEAVSRVAHTIKGAVASLAAYASVDCATALEAAARQGEWPQIRALAPRLDAELAQLESALRRTVLERS